MISVIDIGTGNISSMVKALRAVGADVKMVSSAADWGSPQKILFPGVGAFGSVMEKLTQSGLMKPLKETLLQRKVPYLGVCVGMQVLASVGHENGEHKGLGIFPTTVRALDKTLVPALPHMGWNNVEDIKDHPLLTGLGDHPHFYFLHSYHMEGDAPGAAFSRCKYGDQWVTAAVASKNIFGFQFHPEKSQKNGLKVLENFLNYA